MGPLHWLQLLWGTSTCSGGLLHGWSVDTCSSGVLSRACREIFAPCLEHLFPSFFLPWCLKGCVSPFFFPCSLCFLTHIFPEMPSSCLRGSAVPCGTFVGANWNRLCQAQGSPSLRAAATTALAPTQFCHINPVRCQINKFDIKH